MTTTTEKCPPCRVAPEKKFNHLLFVFALVWKIFTWLSHLICMGPVLSLQHSPVFCVAKRMIRATMTTKSKETIVMRPISKEVQRGFLADFGGLVSVILRSRPSAAGCINSPVESNRGRDDTAANQVIYAMSKMRQCGTFPLFKSNWLVWILGDCGESVNDVTIITSYRSKQQAGMIEW